MTRKNKVKELQTIILNQKDLIKTYKKESSMDQASPSGGWFNAENSFGPATDPTFNTTYLPTYEFTWRELTNLYGNPLVRRVIKLYMDDATKAGFELVSQKDNDAAADMNKEMDDRFQWKSIGRKAIGLEHNYGGCVIFVDVDDGRPVDEPLNENNVRQVFSFRPVERFYATPVSQREMLGEEHPGEPLHYSVQLSGFAKSETMTVHESRLIRYPGWNDDDVLSQYERQKRRSWQVPTVQIIYDTIKRYGIGLQAASSLLQGFTMDVFKVSGLKEFKDMAGLKEYIQGQWQLRTSMNVNIIGAEDSIDRQATPVTGMEEITHDIRRDIGMATGVPVPILFSEESGALGGSTLAESQRVWNGTVSANQKNRHTPMYLAMLKFVALEQKWDIEDIEISYNSIEYRSATEQAELENKDAETAKLFVEMGLPEKNVFDAKLTSGEQQVGKIDYDADAFEKELQSREDEEKDRFETEMLLANKEINDNQDVEMEK